MLLGLYRIVTDLGSPLLTQHLNRRARRGKEDLERLGERSGRTAMMRPKGPLLWVHAASVGESLAALPLIEALLAERPELQVLMTTGTVTSAKLLAGRLPARTIHQFAPLDQAGAWRRFFDHWRPDFGCLVESEIWPNLIYEAGRSQVPLALINGRMSARSASRWRWGRSAATRLLGSFTLCLARSPVDAERLQALGAADVRMLGDLKNAAPPLPADRTALSELRAIVGDRPVWLAASTHPGEDEAILRAHRILRDRHPDLLTVIAPRHPERGAAMAAALRAAGMKVARRSLGECLDMATETYLVDTLGELGLFYRLSSLAFVGGSLAPIGGHNPLEAARLGCLPLFGPHTGNCEETAHKLLEAGAAIRVRDGEDLADAVGMLLADAAVRDRKIACASEIGAAEGAIIRRVLEALTPTLDRQIARRAEHEPDHACA